MRRALRSGAAAAVVLALSGCVSDNFPGRPTVTPAADAGAGPTMLVNAPGCLSDNVINLNYVVFEGSLFWTEKVAGTVNSVSTSGGSKTVIATAQMPGPVAVDGTWIYWVEAGKRIMKKVIRGDAAPTVLVQPGTATEVAGNENVINALLVSNGFLYFGRYTSALKVPTAGGTPSVMPSVTPSLLGQSPQADRGKPAAFAIDQYDLYQTELDHDAITREALDGTQDGLLGDTSPARQQGAPDRIAVSQGNLLTDTIAVVDGNVVWAADKVIYSKPVDAGEKDPSFPSVTANSAIGGFVVSDALVFFAGTAFTQGTDVAKVPLSTSSPAFADAGAGDAAADAGGPATPVIIATDQNKPSQFAADATNIYWRTGDCKIMKLAK
ncbi:MAG TPA: hypothetical protein VH560_11145 [Polyangia bacterium]|nr:hypothetical protein [Polyangia bacterium]